MSKEPVFPELSDPTYRIERRIGSGGGGDVFKAWHIRLEKYVVLKRIRDQSIAAQSSRERSEVDILKNLKHRHLPQVYDFLSDPSGVYTVMEFIAGHSFSELLEKGQRFVQSDLVRWGEQLTSALAYLHQQKPPILHGDINPRNIMLTPSGDLCLIDFNISLFLNDDQTRALGLSHGYAPPELYWGQDLPGNPEPAGTIKLTTEELEDQKTQWLDASESFNPEDTHFKTVRLPHSATAPPSSQDHLSGAASGSLSFPRGAGIDLRSDLYSVGATLYHLATGTRPAIATSPLRPLGDFDLPLSEALIAIIERCLAREPQDRFSTASDLHGAFTNIHRLDSRWRRYRVKQVTASIVLSGLFVLSATSAALGWKRMGYEKTEQYNQLVYQIASETEDASFHQATLLFPNNPQAYLEQAKKLCLPGHYDACIDFIEETLVKLVSHPHQESAIKKIGDLYFILGNAHFELGNYADSIPAYQAASENNPGNPQIIRDYAIALARTGRVMDAEAILREMDTSTSSLDSTQLLQGEIAFAQGKDLEAIHLFLSVISNTDDAHIKNRAYLICDKAYQRVPDLVTDQIFMLQGALRDQPLQYAPLYKERLADAYVRHGDYQGAIELFEDLRAGGNPGYLTGQNLGVLYQEVKNYDEAYRVFIELADLYPDDYRPHMRLAFLELEIQSSLPNELRNYESAYQAYNRALSGHQANDLEMSQLDHLMMELRQLGWID